MLPRQSERMPASVCSARGENSFGKQGFSQGDWLGGVDGQHGNGCATRPCEADQASAVPPKMAIPFLPARVKEEHHLTRLGVDPAQIRPFVVIAMVAGQTEVVLVITAAMLFGGDVLHVECGQRDMLLRQTTVFAAVARAAADALSDFLLHHAASGLPASKARALDCKIEMTLIADT